jgi:lysophospholipase L1-like esterase
MRIRSLGVALLLLVSIAPGVQAAPPPQYYLALGDSLSVGVQPTLGGTRVETNQGYVDDLYAFYRRWIPGLQLAKLGCSGETTATMIAGGICSYPSGSQVAEAVNFLQTHRVAFVTLDIGADNLLTCITIDKGIDVPCVYAAINGATSELPQILGLLRAAVHRGVPIVAMNYYDPILAASALLPLTGQKLADDSLAITRVFNSGLENAFRLFGVRTADVAAAFQIENTTPIRALGLPVNVVLELLWTWMAVPPPAGPDPHPNAVGYAVIAGAFAEALGRP